MSNYVCKIATLEDIIKMYDEEMKEYNDKDKMIEWRNMIQPSNQCTEFLQILVFQICIVCQCQRLHFLKNQESNLKIHALYLQEIFR